MAIPFITGYTPSDATRFSRKSNIRKTQMDGGDVALRVIADVTLWDLSLVYDALSEDEKNTLTEWIEANEAQEIEITVGAFTYTGFIDGSKTLTAGTINGSAMLWRVSFGFEGKKQ